MQSMLVSLLPCRRGLLPKGMNQQVLTSVLYRLVGLQTSAFISA